MMQNFSQYRMTDLSWIEKAIAQMGADQFHKLLGDRYGWLAEKKKGWSYDITKSKNLAAENDKDLFIKTVCLFISEGNGDFVFSDDFTKIRRV